MNWEDERYVRAYTRDTLTWTRLGWQGQAVLLLLMRKVDRAGVVEIDDEEPAVALSGITGIPIEICDVAWLRLSSGKKPTVTIRDGTSRALIIPNFLEAQDARQNDRARAQKSRELRRLVTKRDDPSQGVTNSNDRSQPVTPSCAVPSRTEEEERALSAPAPTLGSSPPSQTTNASPDKPVRKKPETTPEQEACRAKIRERFLAEFAARSGGAEFRWSPAENVAIATLARLDGAGGVDPTKGLRALATFIERMPVKRYYAENFAPRIVVQELNNLRLAVVADAALKRAGPGMPTGGSRHVPTGAEFDEAEREYEERRKKEAAT